MTMTITIKKPHAWGGGDRKKKQHTRQNIKMNAGTQLQSGGKDNTQDKLFKWMMAQGQLQSKTDPWGKQDKIFKWMPVASHRLSWTYQDTLGWFWLMMTLPACLLGKRGKIIKSKLQAHIESCWQHSSSILFVYFKTLFLPIDIGL